MLHPRTAHRHAFPLYGTRLERRQDSKTAEHDEGPGLLVSPAFWIGGVLSLAAWAGLAAALGWI
jgi:hypothetical protein